ncbi:MobA/MobL family protein [Ochrobactrum sp. BTU1]|uniref:MobA/MobL family protein n=1 Tax=Ochrobactrum sp. BTU1 TaxID=2840456 RepID=UPI001C052D66|nr:MobA/MobL family protein [Ochrobactrum sp. BTU1]
MPRPSIAPVWTQDRSAPWNALEAAETLRKSQATRELRLALPNGLLSHEQRVEPVRGFCHRAFVDAGMVTDIA